LSRCHWKNAGPIRRIFKASFERARLPYYNPHSFRHTLARLGEKMRLTPEEWKAYSQNFGHTSPMTTFNSYGVVPSHRQAEILNAMSSGISELAAALTHAELRSMLSALIGTELERLSFQTDTLHGGPASQ
jgi:integrase/recombinase XerD